MLLVFNPFVCIYTGAGAGAADRYLQLPASNFHVHQFAVTVILTI